MDKIFNWEQWRIIAVSTGLAIVAVAGIITAVVETAAVVN